MIGRNDPCWCGSGKKWKQCHYPQIDSRLEKKRLAETYLKQYGILLKKDEEIEGIRRASKLAANILKATCDRARAGVSTQELNDFAHELHLKHGARPAPLGFGDPPFPKSICTSLNDVVCHGIPSVKDILVEGDILSIDVSLEWEGYYGDCCASVVIGKTSEDKQLVVDTSKECLDLAIAVVKPGVLLNEIGRVIEEHATRRGCSSVRQFVGHGIGIHFREPPQVPHVRNSLAIPLIEGMTFTIEPMINRKGPEAIVDPADGWTARTIGGMPTAQWEHLLLVTSDGCEILTLPD